jgi:hypothetical protein
METLLMKLHCLLCSFFNQNNQKQLYMQKYKMPIPLPVNSNLNRLSS